MSTREYLEAIHKKLDAVIATQKFHSEEVARLRDEVRAIKSEMSSNYVAFDARIQDLYEIAARTKA